MEGKKYVYETIEDGVHVTHILDPDQLRITSPAPIVDDEVRAFVELSNDEVAKLERIDLNTIFAIIYNSDQLPTANNSLSLGAITYGNYLDREDGATLCEHCGCCKNGNTGTRAECVPFFLRRLDFSGMFKEGKTITLLTN